MSAELSGRRQLPTQSIEVDNERDAFTLDLLDRLWERYRRRVPHVVTYERIVRDAQATFFNDHIAFRSIAWQQPQTGINSISRIFEALGYLPAGLYSFQDQHLNATHYQHHHPKFPKIFISELKAWELSEAARKILGKSLKTHRQTVSCKTLNALVSLKDSGPGDRKELMNEILSEFHQLPWLLPEKEDIQTLAQESQYGAWVLLHGYNVNHFTALINSHGVPELETIDLTVAALEAAGVPMKGQIEGAPGSKLRQTATGAATTDVSVVVDGVPTKMTWSYAYFELAERNLCPDPETGKRVRFEGFLGPNAAQLFEMTRVK
jgi:hypothetical protein